MLLLHVGRDHIFRHYGGIRFLTFEGRRAVVGSTLDGQFTRFHENGKYYLRWKLSLWLGTGLCPVTRRTAIIASLLRRLGLGLIHKGPIWSVGILICVLVSLMRGILYLWIDLLLRIILLLRLILLLGCILMMCIVLLVRGILVLINVLGILLLHGLLGKLLGWVLLRMMLIELLGIWHVGCLVHLVSILLRLLLNIGLGALWSMLRWVLVVAGIMRVVGPLRSHLGF